MSVHWLLHGVLLDMVITDGWGASEVSLSAQKQFRRSHADIVFRLQKLAIVRCQPWYQPRPVKPVRPEASRTRVEGMGTPAGGPPTPFGP